MINVNDKELSKKTKGKLYIIKEKVKYIDLRKNIILLGQNYSLEKSIVPFPIITTL